MTSTLAERTTAWMEDKGWRQESEGPGGWMWRVKKKSGTHRVGVVRNLDEDVELFDGLVVRLADAERLQPKEVHRQIVFWETDVTFLRAMSGNGAADTIPLAAGAVLLESGRLMFRSAASAAMRIRPEIGGNYSRRGDEIAGTVRMGHSERGSYVVPIYVPVGSPAKDDQMSIFQGEQVETASRVPTDERRMTRTFAEAMQALDALVLQPERLPNHSEINNLVAQGVTREFVSALADIVAEKAIVEFESRFDWAPSQGTPIGVQRRVTVPASEYGKLEHTVRELKRIRKNPFNVLTGPIVMIGKDPDNPLIHVAIKTVRQGRPCRVETWLRGYQLEDVTGWMNRGITVQLEGVVAREGHALRVREPTKFGPVYTPPSLFDNA
jgi:hypothetical protein